MFAISARLPRLPWPWRIGLGVPLLAGIILAAGAAISWLSGGYERPHTLDAGPSADFAPGAPVLFEDDDVWVVRLPVFLVPSGDFLALYDRGLDSGCPLQWRRQFEFMERSGWFVDTCTGSAYDLTGRCFSPPCRGASLDRFSVTTAGGNVVVDLRALNERLPPEPEAEPLNPPAE